MRAVVIGVGHLGKHHARILASLPGVTLAGVVDTNADRARAIAAERGTLASWTRYRARSTSRWSRCRPRATPRLPRA
jgi:predicted dehydrogenase